jgi:hypothetical protein
MSIFEKRLKTFAKNVFLLHNEKLASHDNLQIFYFDSIIFLLFLLKKYLGIFLLSIYITNDNKKRAK